MKVFEAMAVLNPKNLGDGKSTPLEVSRVVVDLERMLVNDEREAVIRMARKIPEDLLGRLDEVEILVRPF